MKSKFATFSDRTVGSVLIFLTATAIIRYYTTLELSLFSAAAVTATVLILSAAFGKRKAGEAKTSKATDDMFYAFMFENDKKPAKLLFKGLSDKGVQAKVIGDALYAGNTACYFYFDAPPSRKDVARMISRASRYGAKRIFAFCKEAPRSDDVTAEGIKFCTVCGDDVYRLYASLGVLPRVRFTAAKNKRRPFRGALGKDKTIRYLLLSLALFALSYATGFSLVALVCAAVCGCLFVTSSVYNAADAIKKRSANSPRSKK